ncbi:hypothetical protein, partial [Bacillus subtilis]|uniref:hypothetical protein n=1 Tax=Bacillus subtilis TaxID=1423 RepID=UPI003C25292D
RPNIHCNMADQCIERRVVPLKVLRELNGQHGSFNSETTQLLRWHSSEKSRVVGKGLLNKSSISSFYGITKITGYDFGGHHESSWEMRVT